MSPEQPDYNYHTSPEQLQAVVDRLGGWPAVLTFCQTHDVTVQRDGTGMEMLAVRRNGKAEYYGTELDPLSAIVMGMKTFQEHNKQNKTGNET